MKVRTLRAGRQRQHPRSSDDQGFSLIEVIVAMVLFSVVVSVVLGLTINIFGVSRGNSMRTTAANLATQAIESARAQSATQVTDGYTSWTETVAGTDFTIQQNANYVSSGSNVSLCASSSSDLAYKLVTITVSWDNMGNVEPARADTILALGVGADGLDSTKGSLAIGVVTSTAGPVAGATVTISPGNQTRVTGADGCAVFVGLDTGTSGRDYTATVTKPGFVTPKLVATGQVTIGAVAGNLRRASVRYDAQRTLTTTTSLDAAYPLPSGLVTSIRSSDLDTGLALATCGAAPCVTAVPGQIAGLFPALYTVRMAGCPVANADVTTQDASTPLAFGRVQTSVRAFVGGQGLSGYTVTATGCDGSSITLPTTGSGGTSRASLPPGTWTVTVRSSSGATSSQPITIGTTAAHEVRFTVALGVIAPGGTS